MMISAFSLQTIVFFVNILNNMNEEEVFEQLGEQIYINFKIAAWKFRNVQRSIRFLAISLILLLITAVYYGVLRIV